MDQSDSRLAHPPGTASEDVAPPFNLQPPNLRPSNLRPSNLQAVESDDRLAFDPVPLRLRHDGLTPEKQRQYVEALADCGIVREAAARVGVSEQAINRVRRRADARDFDRACEAAHMFGARRLRSIAYERAVEGTLKSHYYRGELVGQERVFDNRLLIYLLGKTEPLLQFPEESRTVCDNWEPCMEALEQGVPAPDPFPPAATVEGGRIEKEEEDDNPEVWSEDGIWWTYFPPPEGFDGEEDGKLGDKHYQRTLTEEEEAVMAARKRTADETDLGRCCSLRDSYFGLPRRGHTGFFPPRESRNNETSEAEEGRGERRSPPRHPGEGRNP